MIMRVKLYWQVYDSGLNGVEVVASLEQVKNILAKLLTR